MKKSKLLKSLGFASLALLMGAAGVFAFAPLGASPSVANASEMVDQINTKADGENIKYAPSALGLDPENDPVIYTTESGLEIKFGGLSASSTMSSGALTGYPYFTMGTYNNTAVNWIIIGKNPNDYTFSNAITEYLFTEWQKNKKDILNVKQPKSEYFFRSIYENKTPAGIGIQADITTKSTISDFVRIALNIVSHSEVSEGAVLAISELAYTLSDKVVNAVNSSNYEGSSLQSYHEKFYESDLGLTDAEKAMIIPQTLTNCYYPTNFSTSYNQHMFPLAYRSSSENFIIGTYLPTQALRVANQYHYLRSGRGDLYSGGWQIIYGINANGSVGAGTVNNIPTYIRPVCVISLK